MKVAISSSGQDLNSTVDFRFGRCVYFIIADSETEEFKAITNSNVSASSGAGIQSAQTVINEGVGAVITGQIGPNAHKVFAVANIPIYSTSGGTISENLDKLKKGELTELTQPSVAANFGMGKGMGAGQGRGGKGRWWQQ